MLSMADPKSADIHIFFIPYPARGHTIPLVDTALLFARSGSVRCTVVTTPGNSPYISGTIRRAKDSEGLPIDLELVPFPAADVGLPEGSECTDVLPPGHGLDVALKFLKGVRLLRHPIEKLAVERGADCIVSDVLLGWPADIAESLSVPYYRLSTGPAFVTAVTSNILMYGAASSCPDEAVQLAGLPHPLRFTRQELPSSLRFPGFPGLMREGERRSVGTMFNSLEEMEPEYVEHCRRVNLTGCPMNVWCIGPAQICKSLRADGDWDGKTVKGWLDSKPPESVVYISFGSEGSFGPEQLREIAAGLHSCEHPFVWVVRGVKGNMDEWLPAGFRKGVGGRGMMLTEWAPQVDILNHRAVGGFVTHCGWNSILEAVCAGLPVIAWPLQAEQFVNEWYVVEVMGMGVRVLEGPGMRTVEAVGKGVLKGDLIRNALHRVMDARDEGAIAMRGAAKKYQELARSADTRGSSSVNLGSVIEHMNMLVKLKPM